MGVDREFYTQPNYCSSVKVDLKKVPHKPRLRGHYINARLEIYFILENRFHSVKEINQCLKAQD